jgi:hypothetical protein
VTDECITTIPANRKKRIVLLKWLVEKFESGWDYSEKEVNMLLKQYHEDSATLRREFIGYRLMSCHRGIYRRSPETEWLSEAGNFN